MLQTPLFSTVCKIIAQNILCTRITAQTLKYFMQKMYAPGPGPCLVKPLLANMKTSKLFMGGWKTRNWCLLSASMRSNVSDCFWAQAKHGTCARSANH